MPVRPSSPVASARLTQWGASVVPLLLVVACGGSAGHRVSKDAAQSTPTVFDVGSGVRPLSAEAKSLRAKGASGLVEVLKRYDELSPSDPRRSATADLVDEVAQQRDATSSRLFWYTDIEEAKKVSAATRKPILSLRMLGSLTDEFSCANSRFFRAILYPDARIRRLLEQDFVLHWSSERPAPLITIDFRDGRKVTRTITGNSIHYVLSANGEPIEAMPGLVSQNTFATWLEGTHRLHERFLASNGDRAIVVDHHRAALATGSASYNTLARRAGVSAALPLSSAPTPSVNLPSAALAIPVAPSKAVVEAPLARAAVNAPDKYDAPSTLETIPWQRFVPFFKDDATLSADGTRGLRRKNPQNWSNPEAPRSLTDAEFQEMVEAFQTSLAEDTAKNTLGLYNVIHSWFLATDAPRSFNEWNTRVYSTLFLTPKSDPWLGLVPARAFSGLERDGIQAK
ncbi:MAG: hypothetical protein U0174_20435 [Polyangiaceae bacterium]